MFSSTLAVVDTLPICEDCRAHFAYGDNTALDFWYDEAEAAERLAIIERGETVLLATYGDGAQLIVGEPLDRPHSWPCACCGASLWGVSHTLTVYAPTIERDDRHAFARGYIECALWCGIMPDSDDAESVDACADDLAPEAFTALARDAFEFLRHEAPTLRKAAQSRPWAHLGHDLYLSRNGHGTGYWDRGLGDIGDALHRACQYQSRDLYMGDDGMVHAA